MAYNGWSSKAVWNIALHINNDEFIYGLATSFAKSKIECGQKIKYREFAEFIKTFGIEATGDGIPFRHPAIKSAELDELLKELV